MEQKALWTPSKEFIESTEIWCFITFVNSEYGHNIKGGKDLYKWSVEKIPDFWDASWKYSEIISSKPYDKVIEDLSVFPDTKWFLGALSWIYSAKMDNKIIKIRKIKT